MHITKADRAAISDWAAQRSEIVEVWLYGSRARGDHRDESDIDLAIVMKGTDIDARFLRWPDDPKAWVAALHLSSRPHLEWYDHEADLNIGPNVRRDGILLYCAITRP